MIGIIGKKLGMTQIFNEQGQQVPVTVIEAAPNPVTKVVDKAAAGFAAVELGYGRQRTARESAKGERTPKGARASKAALGHAAKAQLDYAPRVLRSFRLDDAPGKTPEIPAYEVGQTVGVDIFAAGERVKVTGTTKGRGFQGVVKRWGFGGGANTHGNTKHRKPGSIGPGTDPSRVIKGKKMPGHYGAERHTQGGLRVERVDAERNLIYIRGSVAGPTNGIVLVRKQG
ncbi:50S ribosomal protein L3 [Roseisolibacter sp. H3M3-2]|uniref:50S ribosomal protein L3 n=1 Tax=Roseisolibacter sp. H3M3-2 TaxID=3031323 RepID=UPI0023DC661A|nr:50S ribosomal protein L3 [Roseisolibacter sp. H3M3-2]MDF1504306.1 50S ribosomal protein L3 [Roseisolibacter sp. H3M3-2]